MQVKFKRLHDAAVLPKPAHPGDALDLSATHEAILQPNVPTLIKTGWAIEMPPNTRGWVTPRSGLALKHGFTILNAPGLIDEQYRGEICAIGIWNGHAPNCYEIPSAWRAEYHFMWGGEGGFSRLPVPVITESEQIRVTDSRYYTGAVVNGESRFRLAPGDRIAQLTFSRIEPTEIIEADELSTTERGANGFGSSGVGR